MTPAIELLQHARVNFSIHQYANEIESAFAHEAVDKLHLPAPQVFKTLVVQTSSAALCVAMIPSHTQLSLKAMAKVIGCKKVTMADQEGAQRATGYLVGGISPIGQKRKLPSYLDASAIQFDTIYVSGGKRGLEIEITPSDLLQICDAKTVNIGYNNK